jgi:hypothetical protein
LHSGDTLGAFSGPDEGGSQFGVLERQFFKYRFRREKLLPGDAKKFIGLAICNLHPKSNKA